MRVKVFNWTKSGKSPVGMEEEINNFIKDKFLMQVVQNESPSTGRVTLSLFYLNGTKERKPNSEVRVIRTQGHNNLQEEINKELHGIKKSILTVTQSFSANTIVSMIFYEK